MVTVAEIVTALAVLVPLRAKVTVPSLLKLERVASVLALAVTPVVAATSLTAVAMPAAEELIAILAVLEPSWPPMLRI